MGCFATHVARSWKNVAPLPAGVSTKQAAAALVQGLTATTFMTDAYAVQAGDTVLVHTVAGGLGLLFAQVAKRRGAVVIGTTSTPEKAATAKAAGADHVILYKEEDTVQRVLEITGGRGVNAVFDGVGKDTSVQSPSFSRPKTDGGPASRATSRCSSARARSSPSGTRPARSRRWPRSSCPRRTSSCAAPRAPPAPPSHHTRC
jgi:NADPH:quinone reductase-like Zn-dependent oxidoreductase